MITEKKSKIAIIVSLALIMIFLFVTMARGRTKPCHLNRKYLGNLLGEIATDILKCSRPPCDNIEEKGAKVLISHLLYKESGKKISFFAVKSITSKLIFHLWGLGELQSVILDLGITECKGTIDKIKELLSEDNDKKIEGVEFPLGWKGVKAEIACSPLKEENYRWTGIGVATFSSPAQVSIEEIVNKIKKDKNNPFSVNMYLSSCTLDEKIKELDNYLKEHPNKKLKPFPLK